MPSPFTMSCIETNLPCLITKPSFQLIWLFGTQVAAEVHQTEKLDQRKNISTILSLTIWHRISNTAKIVVNTATEKNFTEKL